VRKVGGRAKAETGEALRSLGPQVPTLCLPNGWEQLDGLDGQEKDIIYKDKEASFIVH
jgi:hypothetical protein